MANNEWLDDYDYWLEEEPGDEAYCPFCGKAYEEFGDLGCGYCDRRSPEWGILP